MNHRSKTPTLRDIKVVLGTLGSGLVDALGLSPVPEREPNTIRNIGSTSLFDSRLLEISPTLYPDLACLAVNVMDWMNQQRPVQLCSEHPYSINKAKEGFFVSNKLNYFTLRVGTSPFPIYTPLCRNQQIALVSSDCHPYPLDVRAPIMKSLQDYLAEPQNRPVSPSTPRAA
jgi:hypothetical protein